MQTKTSLVIFKSVKRTVTKGLKTAAMRTEAEVKAMHLQRSSQRWLCFLLQTKHQKLAAQQGDRALLTPRGYKSR